MNEYRYCDHKQCSTISAFCDITLVLLKIIIIDSRKVVTLKAVAFKSESIQPNYQ